MTAYNNKDYYDCGVHVGDALLAVFFKAPQTKKPVDEAGYRFLSGFFQGVEGVEYNQTALYNGINGYGIQVSGPINKTMSELQKNGMTD